ncbi:unnamed protein product, partial [Staurois parvus]
MGPLCPCPNSKKPMKKCGRHAIRTKGTRPQVRISLCGWCMDVRVQGRTDNSWGPRAIGDHGAPVSLPKLKKAYEKGTRGISWGPLLTEFPNGQSAPVHVDPQWHHPHTCEP